MAIGDQNSNNLVKMLKDSLEYIRNMAKDINILNSLLLTTYGTVQDINDTFYDNKKLTSEQIDFAKTLLQLLELRFEIEKEEFDAKSNDYKDSIEGQEELLKIEENYAKAIKARVMLEFNTDPATGYTQLVQAGRDANQIILANLSSDTNDLHSYADSEGYEDISPSNSSPITDILETLKLIATHTASITSVVDEQTGQELLTGTLSMGKEIGTKLLLLAGFDIPTKSSTGSTSANGITSMLTDSSGGPGGPGGIDPSIIMDLFDSGNIGDIITKALGADPMFGVIMTCVLAITEGVKFINKQFEQAISQQTKIADNILVDSSTKKFDSRLYGLIKDESSRLNTNFVSMVGDVVELFNDDMTALFVNEQDLIKNMTSLVNEGIAFNVELRALWMTLSDKIVSTFEVNNETLKKLVLLQQTELTDRYMGVEATITRTLNSMFKDTQYLNSTYDAVWSAMTDTLANVDAELGTAIAYLMQLWLGSLSSLGLSSTAASGIATQVNNLLTGNTDSLSDLGRTLLAMAAARQDNTSFADLLVSGIQSGSDMNDFMKSIITTLLDIYSESKDNNVLLSEWGDILNLSISDWKAISNLTLQQIEILAGQSAYSSTDAINEVEYITKNLVAERVLVLERAENLISNRLFQGGWDLSTNREDYMSWRMGETLADLLQGVSILGGLADFTQKIRTFLLGMEYFSEPFTKLISEFTSDSFTDPTKKVFSLFYNAGQGDNGPIGVWSGEIFSTALGNPVYTDDFTKIANLSYFETLSDFLKGRIVANYIGVGAIRNDTEGFLKAAFGSPYRDLNATSSYEANATDMIAAESAALLENINNTAKSVAPLENTDNAAKSATLLENTDDAIAQEASYLNLSNTTLTVGSNVSKNTTSESVTNAEDNTVVQTATEIISMLPTIIDAVEDAGGFPVKLVAIDSLKLFAGGAFGEFGYALANLFLDTSDAIDPSEELLNGIDDVIDNAANSGPGI